MTTCMVKAVYLFEAGDVFDGVLFVLSFFPRDVLDKSVPEAFPTYFCHKTLTRIK